MVVNGLVAVVGAGGIGAFEVWKFGESAIQVTTAGGSVDGAEQSPTAAAAVSVFYVLAASTHVMKDLLQRSVIARIKQERGGCFGNCSTDRAVQGFVVVFLLEYPTHNPPLFLSSVSNHTARRRLNLNQTEPFRDTLTITTSNLIPCLE